MRFRLVLGTIFCLHCFLWLPCIPCHFTVDYDMSWNMSPRFPLCYIIFLVPPTIALRSCQWVTIQFIWSWNTKIQAGTIIFNDVSLDTKIWRFLQFYCYKDVCRSFQVGSIHLKPGYNKPIFNS